MLQMSAYTFGPSYRTNRRLPEPTTCTFPHARCTHSQDTRVWSAGTGQISRHNIHESMMCHICTSRNMTQEFCAVGKHAYLVCGWFSNDEHVRAFPPCERTE